MKLEHDSVQKGLANFIFFIVSLLVNVVSNSQNFF